MPQILIQKRYIFLDGGWKISIIGNITTHALSIVIVNLIQNGVDAFLKIALGLAVQLIQPLIELNHRVLLLLVTDVGSLGAVGHQLQDTVLHEHHRHLLARYPLCL